MSNGGITLIELHSNGPLFGSRSLPDVPTEHSEPEESETADSDDGDDGGRSLLPFLLIGGVLLVAGLLARKFVGSDGEPETVPLAESDDISSTADASTAD